jgi:hemerythrin-like metal-binding protein
MSALDQNPGRLGLSTYRLLFQESAMNALQWSDALALDFEPMDRVHREFVWLVNRVEDASDALLPTAWLALVDHTAQHFDRENEWLRKTRLPGASEHMLQHRLVLNLLRDGLAMARAGDTASAREMARELAAWFVKHNELLDAALAAHLRARPKTGPSARRASQPRRSLA